MNQERKALLTPLSVYGKPTEIVYQAGKEAERERIIALLQDEITALTQTRISDSWDLALGVQHALALIKGEN